MKNKGKDVLVIARAKRGEFCLEAMENIDKLGYDFVEADRDDCLVYIKYANKET